MLTLSFAATTIVLLCGLGILLPRYLRLQRKLGVLAAPLTEQPANPTDLETKILLSKKQLETTLDAISDLICVINPDYRIARVNMSYAQYVGASVRDLPGRMCYEVFWHRSGPCEDCPASRSMVSLAPVKKAVYVRRVAGEERTMELGTFPVCDEENRVVNIIEHIRDITDEKRMNEQLMRSEKLASIGIMTAGIAHEMTNPLSGISGTAVNLLKMPEKYGLNEKGLERVTTILECAARSTMIMKDLLRFSQKEETVRIPTDLCALIPKVANSVRLPGSSRIQRTFSFEENLPKVRCDPTKIEQVMVNVMTNAIQAIIEKKKTLAAPPDDAYGTIGISARREGDKIQIEITDDGIGIAREYETKIFDPFFSTKAPGEGTGLGLSISHRIIEEHQGEIAATTRGGLTTVTIALPVGSDPWTEADGRRGAWERHGTHA